MIMAIAKLDEALLSTNVVGVVTRAAPAFSASYADNPIKAKDFFLQARAWKSATVVFKPNDGTTAQEIAAGFTGVPIPTKDYMAQARAALFANGVVDASSGSKIIPEVAAPKQIWG